MWVVALYFISESINYAPVKCFFGLGTLFRVDLLYLSPGECSRALLLNILKALSWK